MNIAGDINKRGIGRRVIIDADVALSFYWRHLVQIVVEAVVMRWRGMYVLNPAVHHDHRGLACVLSVANFGVDGSHAGAKPRAPVHVYPAQV